MSLTQTVTGIPNASGKGYKSRKVNVIDWNEKGKAKEWRNAIADVINATMKKQA